MSSFEDLCPCLAQKMLKMDNWKYLIRKLVMILSNTSPIPKENYFKYIFIYQEYRMWWWNIFNMRPQVACAKRRRPQGRLLWYIYKEYMKDKKSMWMNGESKLKHYPGRLSCKIVTSRNHLTSATAHALITFLVRFA